MNTAEEDGMTGDIERLAEIQARVKKATPGEWVLGDRWHVGGVMAGDRCYHCESNPSPAPLVWQGKRDINGKKMLAHIHQSPEPLWGDHHLIYAYNGGAYVDQVAGNYDYEEGGIVGEADAEFIVNARQDIPYLLALVDKLKDAYPDFGYE